MSDTGTSPQSADLCEQSGEHVDRLWESLRTQAGEIAAAEPTLSSLLAEVVLDQPCLGSALGVRLARKLARQDMPCEELVPLLAGLLRDHPALVNSAVADLDEIL